jgi:hypothetical protein
MKSKVRWLGLLIASTSLTLFGPTTVVQAQDDDRARLDRLERRLNELAVRQEQWMRQGRPGPGPQVNPGPNQPQMNQPGPEVKPNQPQGPGPRAPRERDDRDGPRGFLVLLLVVGLICNLLLSVWIYTDIRKRGEGSGIFVALALVAGIPSAIIYSLVRIGDKKSASPS